MGLFNRISRNVLEPDQIDKLLQDTNKEIDNIKNESEYAVAFNLFKMAIDILGNRLNASFTFTIREQKVIMLNIDKWKIYWLSDDPDYITIRDDKSKFDKISADKETFEYTLNHLDTL